MSNENLEEIKSDLPSFITNEDIRARLEEYRRASGLSNHELSVQLGGVGVTQLSKYLNKKADFSVTRLEAVAEDVLKIASTNAVAQALKSNWRKIFETEATRKICARLELITKTNDVGTVHAEAGVGKTCSIQFFQQLHPSVVVLTASRGFRSAREIQRLLFKTTGTRGFKPTHHTKWEFLVEKFKGSNRLIIIDNAHRLTPSAFEWVFDFHDETDAPIALVGNPEMMDGIAANDQQHSRIGISKEIKLTEVDDICRKMIEVIAPDAADDLLALARRVIKEPRGGHVRALRKQLSLAGELKGITKKPWQDSFRGAHTQLIREYAL